MKTENWEPRDYSTRLRISWGRGGGAAGSREGRETPYEATLREPDPQGLKEAEHSPAAAPLRLIVPTSGHRGEPALQPAGCSVPQTAAGSRCWLPSLSSLIWSSWPVSVRKGGADFLRRLRGRPSVQRVSLPDAEARYRVQRRGRPLQPLMSHLWGHGERPSGLPVLPRP